MVLHSLQYVAGIVVPALLVAIAADALRHFRRGRRAESAAWALACAALLMGAVFPEVLSALGRRVGATIPPDVVVALGLGALAFAYGKQALRSRADEARVLSRVDDADDAAVRPAEETREA